MLSSGLFLSVTVHGIASPTAVVLSTSTSSGSPAALLASVSSHLRYSRGHAQILRPKLSTITSGLGGLLGLFEVFIRLHRIINLLDDTHELVHVVVANQLPQPTLNVGALQKVSVFVGNELVLVVEAWKVAIALEDPYL